MTERLIDAASTGQREPVTWFIPTLALLLGPWLVGWVSADLQAEAQPFPFGLPPLQITAPDPEASPQFYTVAQGPDGALYVGGSEAVHVYDGRRWTTVPTPNGQLVRSLAHDGRQRMYVGGYARFGYIEADETGLPVYTDLTPAPEALHDAANFADIWDLLVTEQAVYFRALYHLFRLDLATGELADWHHPGRLGVLTGHDGEVLLQFRGTGLKRYTGDGFELVAGGEQLIEHVVTLLPLPDGGLLTVGRDGQWQRFADGQLTPWDSPSGLPGPESFDASLVLPDGSFALGGADGRMHLVEPLSRRHHTFRVSDGFISELAPATGGGILVQDDSATTHLFWPSRWTRLGADTGLAGRVEAVAPWQGGWVVISNSGVFRTTADGERFARTDWTQFEAWDWLEIDADTALLADSFAIRRIHADGRVEVAFTDLYPRLLQRSLYDPDRIHVGTERGLALLARDEQQWRLHFAQPGFTGRVVDLVELDERDLLLAVAGHGMVRARYSPGFDALESWETLDTDHGLEYGHRLDVHLAQLDRNTIAVSTAAGLYRWTGEDFQPTDLHGLQPRLKANAAYRLAAAPDGTWWAWQGAELWRRPPGGEWTAEELATLKPGVVTSLTFVPDQPVLVGAQAAVLAFDETMTSLEPEPVSVALRSAILTTRDGSSRRLPLDGRQITLPHDIVSIVFEFALPSYRQPELRRYRARMLGYEDHFSEWGQTTRITYSVFRPGPKRFEVEARDSLGRLSRGQPFEFEILPPWYRTAWAWALWVATVLLLFSLLVYGILRWRLARLTAERERLAGLVEERTAELAAANRKLRNMANIDGLTGVANRRRLDEFLDEAWQRCRDRPCRLSVILIDVDHFKVYNDTHGHQAGDRVLREVAAVLTGCLRRNEDVVARYGGEEFMVVMPAAGTDKASVVAEHMRAAIEASPLGVTVSLGVASIQPAADNRVDEVIEAADRALYRAKEGGRNRVEVD